MKLQFKLLLFLLLAVTGASAQVVGPERPYSAPSLPAATGVPSGFQKNKDVLFLPDGTGYRLNSSNQWILYKAPWAGVKGPQGDKGDPGANGMNGLQGPQGPQGEPGVCPPCPTSSGAGFPAVYGKTAFPTNQTEYLNAVRGIANGSIRNITLFNDIVITADYQFPDTVTNNNTKQTWINLNNYGLIDGSASGLKSLLPRIPEDQTEANNVMQSWSYHISNGYLRGKGSSTLTAIDLGATYNSNIHDLQLDNFKDGVVVRFALMSTIRNIMVNGVTNNAIVVTRGNWSGVGTANSQSNHTLVEQVRVFNVDGANAAFYVENASGTILRQCISEGGSPNYHVLWNSLGSTVCKDGWIMSLHLESPSRIAGIKAYLASGYFIASGNFSQYDNVLYDIESSLGYPHMYVENVPWMTSGSKLKTTGTSVIWSFSEVAFDPSVATLWVGSYKPYYWYQEGFNQSKFLKGNSVTVNNQAFSTSAARMVGQPFSEFDADMISTASGFDVVILNYGVEKKRESFTDQKSAIAYYNEINADDLKKGKYPNR